MLDFSCRRISYKNKDKWRYFHKIILWFARINDRRKVYSVEKGTTCLKWKDKIKSSRGIDSCVVILCQVKIAPEVLTTEGNSNVRQRTCVWIVTVVDKRFESNFIPDCGQFYTLMEFNEVIHHEIDSNDMFRLTILRGFSYLSDRLCVWYLIVLSCISSLNLNMLGTALKKVLVFQ